MFRRKVMAYGMEQLRKAGKALQNFDDAYSKKVGEMYAPLLMDKEGNAKGNPIASMGIVMGSQLGGAASSTRPFGATKTEGLEGRAAMLDAGMTAAVNYGVPAVSAMSKYGMPAVGVTMAGQGIIDLTAAFGTTADQPEPNTLGM